MKNKFLYILVLLFFLIAIFRVSYLMLFKYDYYKNILDEKNNKYIYSSSAPRGRILDRNGNILVDNKGIKTIVYNKLSGISEIEEIKISRELAKVLDIDFGSDRELRYFYYINNKEKVNNLVKDKTYKLYEERKITSDELLNVKLGLITSDMLESMSDIDNKAANIYNIMNTGYNYQDKVIKIGCTDNEYSIITELKLIGVRTELSFERVYNYGDTLYNLLGNVGLIQRENLEYYKNLGYSNDDIVGTSYLEKYYEEYLKGEKARYRINNDNTISLISEAIIGNDLILNIDIELQQKIEKLLDSEILKAKEYDSARYYNGSYIIVSDPNDGGILAMVGRSYNNGKFYNNEIGIINKSYAVGSIVKAASISVGYKYGIMRFRN